MTPEPLKGKIKTGWSGDAEAVSPEDIKSAVEWLKKEIRELPNRDDMIQKHQKIKLGILDGGGVGCFNVLDLIDKAFEDIKGHEGDNKIQKRSL